MKLEHEQEEWTRRQTAAFGNLIIMGYAVKQDMVMKERTRKEMRVGYPWPTFASVFIDLYHIIREMPLATPQLNEMQLAHLQASFDFYYSKIHAQGAPGTRQRFDSEWFAIYVSHEFVSNDPKPVCMPVCFEGRYANLVEVLMYVIEHGATGFSMPAVFLPNVWVEMPPDPKQPNLRRKCPLYLYKSDELAKNGRYIWRLDLLTKKAFQERRFVVMHTYD